MYINVCTCVLDAAMEGAGVKPTDVQYINAHGAMTRSRRASQQTSSQRGSTRYIYIYIIDIQRSSGLTQTMAYKRV